MADKKNKANAAAPEATVEELMKQLAEERAAKEAAEKKAAEAEKAKADAEAALAEKEEKETGIFINTGTASDDAAAKAAAKKAYYNELVPVMLFKDNDKYKDDVFVAHNGRTYQIKRGVQVMVPRKVALILERSKEQDMQTANLIQQKEAELKAKEKALNI